MVVVASGGEEGEDEMVVAEVRMKVDVGAHMVLGWEHRGSFCCGEAPTTSPLVFQFLLRSVSVVFSEAFC